MTMQSLSMNVAAMAAIVFLLQAGPVRGEPSNSMSRTAEMMSMVRTSSEDDHRHRRDATVSLTSTLPPPPPISTTPNNSPAANYSNSTSHAPTIAPNSDDSTSCDNTCTALAAGLGGAAACVLILAGVLAYYAAKGTKVDVYAVTTDEGILSTPSRLSRNGGETQLSIAAQPMLSNHDEVV